MGDKYEVLPGNRSISELARGYAMDAKGTCSCIHCGKVYEAGLVYEMNGALALAERAAAEHVKEAHDGAFKALLGQGSQASGLTDIQLEVLRLLSEGNKDGEIARSLGGRSESTVRNHRFNLRKRAAEARVFLALMTLLEEKMPASDKDRFVEYPASLPTRDERSLVTEAEAAVIEARCLARSSGGALRVTVWPKKQKEKLVVLLRLAALFETGKRYTEAEVNAILMPVFDDYVTIRRYLIEYRFLDREAGGGAYWRT